MLNPSDPFRGLAVFTHVVDAGSFTRAAERLDMTKSGVAKSIGRLEAALGVRLFARTTRRLSLTEEGRRFSDGCQRALLELHEAEAAVTQRQSQLTGRLRVSLPVVLGRRWVLPMLLRIAEHHPGLELDVVLTDRVVDLVDERFDLVIRIGQIQDSASLVARRLGEQQGVVCAHPDYLTRRGVPETLDDLNRHDCITFGRGSQARPWFFTGSRGRSQAARLRGRLGFNDSEAILQAALAGLGIAFLTDWLAADHLSAGTLKELTLDMSPQAFAIHAVWQKNPHLSARVRQVVDLLVARFEPTLPWETTR